MKPTGFFNRETFRVETLMQLFNRGKPAKKSNSIEDLRTEISTKEYRQKIERLLKQDLLLKYNAVTVEQVLKNFRLHLIPIHPLNSLVEEEEEPVLAYVEHESEVKEQEYKILNDEKQQEIWKVERRIPKWFKKPYQYNTQILLAFMELLGDGKSVSYFDLESACRKIKTFEGNYNQMKNFGISNHAKVFEEAGGRVTLWEPVREFVKKEYLKSKR